MDRHWLAVVVENDDLKELAGSVSTDVEVTVALADYVDGVADRVLDVLVGNTVFSGAVGNLHLCRLPCLPSPGKLSCDGLNRHPGVDDLPLVLVLICR